MKGWITAGALLVSACVGVAGAADGQWKKSNPYNAKLPEQVSTLALSGLNIRLGVSLERLTLLSGEGHTGKKVAGAAAAGALAVLGLGNGQDMAAREPLEDHFSPDDATRIATEMAASIQQHLVVPGATVVAGDALGEVPALRAGKVKHALADDRLTVKNGRFGKEYVFGYYMVPVSPYGYRARPKLGFTIGDGEVAPAVRTAAGAQAAMNVDVFLVNTRKAFQVQELKVEVLAPQMIGRGRDTPTVVFDLPEGALSVPIGSAGHKGNYAAWQQMKPQFEATLAELGSQIAVVLAKGR